jgi:hypothetical protein
MEEEGEALRRGKRPSRTSLEFSDGALKVTQKGEAIETSRVEDQVRMQEVLKLRSTAHELAQMVTFTVYDRLSRIYLGKLRQTVPNLMRTPTINEIRMVDRVIHQECLKRLAAGRNTLEESLLWFISTAGMQHKVWKFLDPQMATLPDQGLEKRSTASIPIPPQVPAASVKHAETGERTSSGQGRCMVCGKSRAEHPKKLFCSTKGGKKGDGKQDKAGEDKGWKRPNQGDKWHGGKRGRDEHRDQGDDGKRRRGEYTKRRGDKKH